MKIFAPCLVFLVSLITLSCEQRNPLLDLKDQADTYMRENAKREGVIVTDSGLQYEIIVQGEGAKPAETDSVVINYRGRRTNGWEFDSSYSRGEPSRFLVSALIPGMGEGLQLMPVGSVYFFVVPPDLAYGQYGYGIIGPYEVLLFQVELLEIL